jgi:hypothetical protein
MDISSRLKICALQQRRGQRPAAFCVCSPLGKALVSWRNDEFKSVKPRWNSLSSEIIDFTNLPVNVICLIHSGAFSEWTWENCLANFPSQG